MALLLFLAIIANIYVIVFQRLMIGYHIQQATGKKENGFFIALSIPGRLNLPDSGLKYYRRYWYSVASLVLLIALGVTIRYQYLSAATSLL